MPTTNDAGRASETRHCGSDILDPLYSLFLPLLLPPLLFYVALYNTLFFLLRVEESWGLVNWHFKKRARQAQRSPPLFNEGLWWNNCYCLNFLIYVLNFHNIFNHYCVWLKYDYDWWKIIIIIISEFFSQFSELFVSYNACRNTFLMFS